MEFDGALALAKGNVSQTHEILSLQERIDEESRRCSSKFMDGTTRCLFGSGNLSNIHVKTDNRTDFLCGWFI